MEVKKLIINLKKIHEMPELKILTIYMVQEIWEDLGENLIRLKIL